MTRLWLCQCLMAKDALNTVVATGTYTADSENEAIGAFVRWTSTLPQHRGFAIVGTPMASDISDTARQFAKDYPA